MKNLRIFNAIWSSRSAGPSTDNNRRTEIFLAGCQKALDGDPCKGCFNQELWDPKGSSIQTPREAFNHIRKYAPNKFITFVGGEPLDQTEPLAELCRQLKKDGYHIIVITHHLGESVITQAEFHKEYKKLIQNIDALIDGEYMEAYRIWDESKAGDGVHDVIGSGNQRIFDFRRMNRGEDIKAIPAGSLERWEMDEKQDFVYIYKEGVLADE